MRTTIKFISLAVAAAIFSGCVQKPVKTIENLKTAFDGESTASAKYAAFAEKAKAEGLDTIAVMFMATSKAEAIHAANHLKVLEKLGVKVEGPRIGGYEVKTTAENLADAINGEGHEVESMYPGFITEAENEKAADAIKSFGWAVDTEKKHKAFYKSALDALNGGGESSLPFKWLVCPVCGNTYDLATMVKVCDLCMTSGEKFITF